MAFNAENFLTVLRDEQVKEILGEIIKNKLTDELQRVSNLFDDKIKLLREDLACLRSENELLRQQVNDQRQYSMKEDLIIHDVNLAKSVNLKADFAKLCKEDLKIDVAESDISAAHPLGPSKDNKRPVIIRFTNRSLKLKIYKSRVLLNKRPKGCKVFINEHLTKDRAKTFKKARDMKSVGELQDAWTYDCALFARDNKGVTHRISTEADLSRIARLAGPTIRSTSVVKKYETRSSSVTS